MDQTQNGSKWNRLGSWQFPAGWNKIAVDRWTESLQGWAVADAIRLTPSTACAPVCPDRDGDGTSDCNESCPDDPAKTSPGECGCGAPDTNTDGDGYADCAETCDADPAKTAPGVCGCGVPDTNTDGDALLDCQETCDADPAKTAPGVCGCGVADTNTDGDAFADCQETCDADPAKSAPGVCGCGVPDANTDGDAMLDCQETCDLDPAKTAPGICGCGVADADTDGDGWADCQETCDTDPAKTAPGACGCGMPDIDQNGDGTPDCAVCGDGIVQPPETCDDQNFVAGDGCAPGCDLEVPRLRAPQPGAAGVPNTWRATGFLAGDRITFLASNQPGRTAVPGCPGVTIPFVSPIVIGSARADNRGTATLQVPVPANAAGRTFSFVAVDLSACAVSNAPAITFQ
jgi:cysteine-rich repeat protein